MFSDTKERHSGSGGLMIGSYKLPRLPDCHAHFLVSPTTAGSAPRQRNYRYVENIFSDISRFLVTALRNGEAKARPPEPRGQRQDQSRNSLGPGRGSGPIHGNRDRGRLLDRPPHLRISKWQVLLESCLHHGRLGSASISRSWGELAVSPGA